MVTVFNCCPIFSHLSFFFVLILFIYFFLKIAVDTAVISLVWISLSLSTKTTYTLSCIMWQSSLATCGHVGVATRAGGVCL